jgi:lipoyl(octanoyl) transferase
MIHEAICRAGGRRGDPAELQKQQPEGLSYNSFFTSLIVYHDIDSRSAAMNMAIDEALLETATVPAIRFYQWDHPALSFGYFGKFDDVADYDRDIVRRWTGGGVVFHGEDLTYSVVIPSSDVAFSESSMSIYEKIHRAVCAVLQAHGTTVAALYERRLEKASAVIDRRYNRELCFSNPVKNDLMSNGRKVAGAAQRRIRRGLLQQGSIQNVEFGNGFGDSFARALCHECCEKPLDDALLACAEQIAQRKYGTDAWLRKR